MFFCQFFISSSVLINLLFNLIDPEDGLIKPKHETERALTGRLILKVATEESNGGGQSQTTMDDAIKTTTIGNEIGQNIGIGAEAVLSKVTKIPGLGIMLGGIGRTLGGIVQDVFDKDGNNREKKEKK